MRTRLVDNKQQVFCDWRKKYVRLTPEEWVRQTFLHRLVEEYAYPTSLIAVEVQLTDKRADAIIYTAAIQPIVLIECKADTVPLTQQVLDQAVTYNRQLHVPFLILHNGRQTIVAHVTDTTIEYLRTIPHYTELSPKH